MDRITDIQSRIDSLKEKKVQVLAELKAKEDKEAELLIEMQKLGVSPDTIDKEHAKMSEELDRVLDSLEAMILDFERGDFSKIIINDTFNVTE